LGVSGYSSHSVPCRTTGAAAIGTRRRDRRRGASRSRHRAHVERTADGPGASGPARGFKFRLGPRVPGLGAALRGRSRTTRTMATPTHPFRCDVFRILPPGLLWTGGPLTISATSCTRSKRFLTIAWPFASVLLPLSYFQPCLAHSSLCTPAPPFCLLSLTLAGTSSSLAFSGRPVAGPTRRRPLGHGVGA
jgi:hypothetical protein